MGGICMERLSGAYRARRLTEADIPEIYALCAGNPQYYAYCPPQVSPDAIRRDLSALPDGKSPEDKHFIGFYREEMLAAVMDVILAYPDAQTVFIGFFMTDASLQGLGVGTTIIGQALSALKEDGFVRARLGYAKGNRQSEAFWLKNGFAKMGRETDAGGYFVVAMEKML